MAKYDKDTKFYWLQLKEDFFEDDAIEWLEEQKPNGRDYAYFYLKLCLKSLKSNGILIRQVGNILIPYDNTKLAELTKMDFDTVTVAMELLKQIGLIKILENGEIYVTQLENLIGSTSKGAFKKQLQLSRRKEDIKQLGWNEGGKNSTKDKDKDKTKTKDILLSCEVSNVEENNDKVKTETYKEIIDYMNTVYQHNKFIKKVPFSYRYNSKNTKSLINARIRDGYTINDFKDVIWWGYRKFVEFEFKTQNEESSVKYFRPSTLFNEKHFEDYLNEYRANTE